MCAHGLEDFGEVFDFVDGAEASDGHVNGDGFEAVGVLSDLSGCG